MTPNTHEAGDASRFSFDINTDQQPTSLECAPHLGNYSESAIELSQARKPQVKSLSFRYPLLWVDMKLSKQDMDTASQFERVTHVHQYTAVSSLDSEIARINPAVICFDFDFPTKQGLKMLQQTKQQNTSVPILMLTVQHSEALAVWAFRSRVWDYLVKPISQRELDRCFCALSEMLSLRALQTQPRTAAIPMPAIPDENRGRGPRGNSPITLAPVIEYVEDNYRQKISSAVVAEICNLSTFQLSRLFKETYGLTFQEYILRFRIREACRLLKNPIVEVTEVAHLVGFQDPSYFGKIFRRYMHCSPSQFRNAHEAALDPDLLSTDLRI